MPKEKATTQVIEYDITTAAIEEMRQKYSGMKITDTASDKAVRAARTFMVSKRTAVEKRRVELNDEANKHRHRVNEKAKEITALLLPIEEPLQIEVKRVDDEMEARRKEKARIEEERIQSRRDAIYKIQMLTGGINMMDLESLQKLSGKLEAMEITSEDYMELAEEANKVLDNTYDVIQEAITTRIKLDKEAEERKAEDARLEKIRKKQEADQKKIDEANKKIKAAQKKIDDDKKADEQRKKDEEFMKAATERAEAYAAQKVKDDAIAEEERQKLAAAEKERKAAMAPDREKLIKWIEGFNTTNNPSPQLKSKKAQEILRIALEQIEMLLQDVETKIKKL